MSKRPQNKKIEPFQFKPGQSGNPNGRPRKYVTTLKNIGYSRSEINDTLQVFLAMDLQEITEIAENEKGTILEQIVAKALIQARQKGSLYNIETILSRVYGTPKAAEAPPPPPPDTSISLSTDVNKAARQYQELMR